MTDKEIKLMLKDIIDNDAEYEIYKQPCHIKKGNTKCLHTNLTCPECINKHSVKEKYKLGDEIHSNWEYRKIEKWLVLDSELEDSKYVCIPRSEYERKCPYAKSYFTGLEEECEQWIEEHTKKTWLEEYVNNTVEIQFDMKYGREELSYDLKSVIKEVCKKILEELEKCNCYSTDLLREVIQKLGIGVEKW